MEHECYLSVITHECTRTKHATESESTRITPCTVAWCECHFDKPSCCLVTLHSFTYVLTYTE